MEYSSYISFINFKFNHIFPLINIFMIYIILYLFLHMLSSDMCSIIECPISLKNNMQSTVDWFMLYNVNYMQTVDGDAHLSFVYLLFNLKDQSSKRTLRTLATSIILWTSPINLIRFYSCIFILCPQVYTRVNESFKD